MNWRKWLDECGLAARGVILATREKTFWLAFVPAFIAFGWLINMLSSGFSKFQLLFQLPFPHNLDVAGQSLLAVFGVNQIFTDWLPVFAIALLQGMLIALIVLLARKKRLESSAHPNKSDSETSASGESAHIQRAGIITGLIALGAGCPTCGTTLLTPLLGVIFSTGGLAVTGVVSTLITWVAVIIALLSLKRLGLENYVIIKNEKYLAKKEARE